MPTGSSDSDATKLASQPGAHTHAAGATSVVAGSRLAWRIPANPNGDKRRSHPQEPTQAPISVIAASVGYRSNAAFTRAFSKRYGITPKQWRARGQNSTR